MKMDIKLLPFLGLVALAACKDLKVGIDAGEKIFDEKKEASPAIWIQNHNVTVTANETEVIAQVIVTDLRPEKDGEAKIVEGGEGQKNITIELKSPAVFRGYNFHIEVYAAPEEEYIKKGGNKDKQDPKHPIQSSDNVNRQVPITLPHKLDSSTKVPPVNLATDVKVEKRETTEQSQPTVAPKLSSTTKDPKNPAFLAKDGADHDQQPIVPLVMPILKPTLNTKESAKSDEKSSETKQERASTQFSDDSKLTEIKPTEGFTTLAKNVNVNAKTMDTVIGSKTTPAPRHTRETNEATSLTPKTQSRMLTATESVDAKTNAPANTKVEGMKPYPMLLKDLENSKAKTTGMDYEEEEMVSDDATQSTSTKSSLKPVISIQ